MIQLPYPDRSTAGRDLARHLESERGRPGLLVLALPRGGVVVAAEVARALAAEFDILAVRKLDVPWHPELALGAIASDRTFLRNEPVIRACDISEDEVWDLWKREREKLQRCEASYRSGRPPANATARPVLIVDDGLDITLTMQAAITALKKQSPAEIIVAAPVGYPQVVAEVARLADAVVCPSSPAPLSAIRSCYEDFAQPGDGEVAAIVAGFPGPIPSSLGAITQT